ncbi:MAG TPA: TonB-dependent receptor [Candidatus Acidoferrum sp.]|nr:TonB-dependent receptor [Candidatus Acidoferrum sp.]
MSIFVFNRFVQAGIFRPLLPMVAGSVLMLAGTAALADDTPGAVEEIAVFGKGETRQVQSLTATQLDEFPAGTSPLRAIEKLPGVNFQAADPYGAYEWSARIVVRGFNQNQMGFTLDGVPLGDMSYGNHNGLHISRAIMTENMGMVSLAQGAGALATASTSNLGGTLAFTSRDPDANFGVATNGTVGSDAARRGFIRFDTGTLGETFRAYLSVGDQSTDKWKGNGDQQQQYVNAKFVTQIGKAELSGYYDHSDRAEIDYQDMSLDMIRRLGRDFDNYYPDYARAIAAAQGQFSGGVNSLDDGYWNASGLRKDDLGYLKLSAPIDEFWQVDATWYKHTNDGQGLWGTPYLATPGGAPISIRTTEYNIDRDGIIAGLTWTSGDHHVNFGLWYENNDFDQARRFYGEPSSTVPTRDFTEFQTNPFFTQWEYAFNTETWQFHVQDTWNLTDKMRVQYGFKSLNVDVTASTITGDNKTGEIKTDKKFLPQASFVYALGDRDELFGAITRNVHALVGTATGVSPFSATQAGFDAIKNTIKPETATTVELGWRWNTHEVQAVASVYHVDFKDRLLAIQQGSAIIGNFSALANVGRVTSVGVESGLNWRVTDRWTWFNSASYNRSTYEDNFMDGATLVPVKGKLAVDSPEWMFSSELGFDTDQVFGKLGYKYTGERFYTYLNDGKVDAFGMVNATLGFKFGKQFGFKALTAQLDVTNLLNKDYIATVGSAGFSNSDPTGTGQTLLPGAPRQLFFSLKALF